MKGFLAKLIYLIRKTHLGSNSRNGNRFCNLAIFPHAAEYLHWKNSIKKDRLMGKSANRCVGEWVAFMNRSRFDNDYTHAQTTWHNFTTRSRSDATECTRSHNQLLPSPQQRATIAAPPTQTSDCCCASNLTFPSQAVKKTANIWRGRRNTPTKHQRIQLTVIK